MEALIAELMDARTSVDRLVEIQGMDVDFTSFPELHVLQYVRRGDSYSISEAYGDRITGSLESPAALARVLEICSRFPPRQALRGFICTLTIAPCAIDVIRAWLSLEAVALDREEFWMLTAKLCIRAEEMTEDRRIAFRAGAAVPLVHFLLSNEVNTPIRIGWESGPDVRGSAELDFILSWVMRLGQLRGHTIFDTRTISTDRILQVFANFQKVPLVSFPLIAKLIPKAQLLQIREPLLDCVEQVITTVPFVGLGYLMDVLIMSDAEVAFRDRCVTLLRSRGAYSLDDFLLMTCKLVDVLFRHSTRTEVEALLESNPDRESPLGLALLFVAKNQPSERAWAESEAAMRFCEPINDLVRHRPNPGHSLDVRTAMGFFWREPSLPHALRAMMLQ